MGDTRRSRFGRVLIRAAWLAVLAAAASSGAACTKARAETVPDGPPLATPVPPPRVLAPVEEVLAEAPPPPEVPPETRQPAPVSPRPAPRRPPAAATEPKAAETPPPVQPTAPVVEAPVRTPPTNPVEEKKITDLLARAQRDLGRVDYQKLTSDGKQQYDEAKRFSELAEGMLKERDYALAATLADKAATVAAGLLGR